MNSANRTETPIARATVTRTAATKRGARARKLRLNREPSAQPSNNCAPLSNTRGIAEVLTPAIVSGIVIKSAPKTKALGTFRRVSSRPTAAVSDSSAARAGNRTSLPAARKASAPCKPSAANTDGMVTTTSRIRIDCAAATWSTRAPNRSPSTAISAAPPGTLANTAVVRSVPPRTDKR